MDFKLVCSINLWGLYLKNKVLFIIRYIENNGMFSYCC